MASGKVGDGAAPSVEDEHQALEQDEAGEDCGEAESMEAGGDRNGEDACDEEEPDHRVEELDGDDDRVGLGLGFDHALALLEG